MICYGIVRRKMGISDDCWLVILIHGLCQLILLWNQVSNDAGTC